MILSVEVYGQIRELKFRVINAETQEPISYVNVGVLNKSIGTNSDINGEVTFKFSLDDMNSNDLIVISCIGYYKKSLKLSELLYLDNKTVELQPKTSVLKEVTISDRELKARILGKKSKGALTHVNIYSVKDSIDDGLSQEFGVILKNKRNCIINSFNFFLSSNNFDNIKFRFILYEYMHDGSIGNYLIDDHIYFEVKNSHIGWVQVDLNSYEIEFEGKDIIATVQIIETYFSKSKPKLALPLVTPSPFNGFLYRDKSQSEWLINRSANPSIYLEAVCE